MRWQIKLELVKWVLNLCSAIRILRKLWLANNSQINSRQKNPYVIFFIFLDFILIFLIFSDKGVRDFLE